MKYNFDELINRKNTHSIKWSGDFLLSHGIAKRFDEKTIPLFTADMDFQSPQEVISALQNVVNRKIYGYSSHETDPAYFQAIISWFKRRNNWDISREEIIYVNGTVEAVKLAVLAFSKKKQGVIIQRPVYSPFSKIIEKTGRQLINNQLINNNGYYTIDFEDLKRKAEQKNNKILILCSPHNPVGRVWTKDELLKISEICLKNDVVIIADEIHGDILRKNVKFIPIASIADPNNIISCTAINKTFNLAGIQCTNVIIKKPNIRKIFSKTAGHILPTPFAVSALISAYNKGEDWLNQVNEYITSNIDWSIEFLKNNMPKLKVYRPEGTYMLWMDFSEYGLSDQEIKTRIYDKANVILQSGSDFDPDKGHSFERICLPCPRILLKKAFERIATEF